MKKASWLEDIRIFAKPHRFRSFIYVMTSIVPYLCLLAGMIILHKWGFPYGIILILSLLAAGFFVRTFMVLHDCAHGSFITSKKVSTILGYFCGILTLTPYSDWQRSHIIHHSNVGNLDKRGIGDVWTMTVKEYEASTSWGRLKYRVFRNPFFLFILAPQLLFILSFRFPQKNSNKKDSFSIVFTDLILILTLVVAYFTIGIGSYLAVQLPIWFIGTSAGVWLFYIQHQFRNVLWQRQEQWDFITAATEGSSFYKLPGFLRWFTGNIGYHNIHHLNARIPCYNLKRCYDHVPELHDYTFVTFISAFKSLRLHLWDEDKKKLVSFNEN